MNIVEKVRLSIRDVPDFPKPGILFKDITPILENPVLCREIIEEMAEPFRNREINAIVGVESRGFLFGMMLAQHFNVPFVPVRKAGKLPHQTISWSYNLEYGSAVVEMHQDALKPGWNVLVHDDLLATGGTAAASAELVQMQQAKVVGFTFVVELGFLSGRKHLEQYGAEVLSLISY
ncbi:MAG: adenine phosphoribosyltransferase [Bacteroidia bacterium]|nr:adenine phosphoribosyltransferase [Bacteroidia bacterium]